MFKTFIFRTSSGSKKAEPRKLWLLEKALVFYRARITWRIALLAALIVSYSNLPAAASTSEYEVKAAFVFNFAKFVEWPSRAFESSNSPLIIAIFGSDQLADALEPAVKNETIGGRRIVVRRTKHVRDIIGCHIVFIGRSGKSEIGRIIDSVKGSNVLTIGETDGFARRGGIINFFVQDQKVRFEINNNNARHAGLKISSKLLNLAKIVEDK